MHLTCRFAPAIAAICLLFALFALAIISGGDDVGTVSSQGEWLRNTGTKWKRDDTLMSLRRSGLRSAGESRDGLDDTVVTITVCATVDSLPTLAANSPSAFTSGPYNSGLVSTSSANAVLGNGLPNNITSGNAGSRNTAPNDGVFISTTSAYNSTSLGVPSCGSHPTSPGLVCQYYPSTIYATDCSSCVRTSTVTNTYFSTVSSCNATKISFIAAFTVTVTANLSASVMPFLANNSLIVTSSKSITEVPSLLLPTGTLTSSVIICPNGTLEGSPKDCALSSNTILSTSLSQTSQIATILGSFLTTPGLASALPKPSSFAGNPNNSRATGQGDIPAVSSHISGIITGIAVISNTVSDVGLSSPAISLGDVSSITSLSAIVLANASSIEPPTPSPTSSQDKTSSISLPGNVLGESLLSSLVADSQSPKFLPTSVGTNGPLSSFASSANSGPISAFTLVAMSSKLSIIDSSDVNFVKSSKLSSVSLTQGLLPSMGSGDSAAVNSALPSVTGTQDFATGVSFVPASFVTEISSAQVLISSAVNDVTAAAGSVLPIVTSISAVLNGILSEVHSQSSSVFSPIVASQGPNLSLGNNPTAVLPSLTTSMGTTQPSVLSNISPTASSVPDPIHSLVPSIESDASSAKSSLAFSVPAIPYSVVSNLSPSATSAPNSGQSSTPSVASSTTTVPAPLLTPVTAVANSGQSNGRPAADSSVSSITNSAISSVNSISDSIPASLHSTPDEVSGSGNILASIVRPITSAIPSIASAISDIFGAAVGRGIVRDHIPSIVTVTRAISVVTAFKPSATPIAAL